jgi:hypothetical protein
MIYFFETDGQLGQAEISPERPYTLECIEATGASQTERFWSATDLDKRWNEVPRELHEAGWSDPFGRDGRARQSPGRRSDGQ